MFKNNIYNYGRQLYTYTYAHYTFCACEACLLLEAQIDAANRKADSCLRGVFHLSGAKEREAVKAQVVAASKDDLQAMINARLKSSS